MAEVVEAKLDTSENVHTPKLLEKLRRTLIDSQNPNSHNPTECVLLLFRHAERPFIPVADGPSFHVGLTEPGYAASTQLGHSMHHSEFPVTPSKLASSPYPRCMETLRTMAEAAGWTNEIESMKELFGHNILFHNDAEAPATYKEYGCPKLLATAFAKSCTPLGGFLLFEEAARRTTQFFLDQMNVPAVSNHNSGLKGGVRLVIMMSHDCNLALLISRYFGVIDYDDDNWPGYLELIAFTKFKNGDVTIHWRDQAANVKGEKLK